MIFSICFSHFEAFYCTTSRIKPLFQTRQGLDGAPITAPSQKNKTKKTTPISSVAARLPPSSANCPPTVQANCAASLFSDAVSLCVSSLVTARSSPSQLTVFGMRTHRRRSHCVSGAGQVSNDWRCWHSFARCHNSDRFLYNSERPLGICPPQRCLPKALRSRKKKGETQGERERESAV